LRRRASLEDFSDGFVKSPEVQQMMKRIKTFLDPEIEASGYNQISSRIEVKRKDGRILKKDSGPYKGGPERPLSEAELGEKFGACAGLVLPAEKTYQALNLMKQIEKLQDIRFLIHSLLPD
jgi:2-methylcitrate dehydratase PrpD